MSRKGDPYDNAKGERFLRTLKEEEVEGKQHRDLEEVRSRMEQFLEETYNRQRLHSALRYVTPVEFEQAAESDDHDRDLDQQKTKTECLDFFFPSGCLSPGVQFSPATVRNEACLNA